MGNSFGDRMMRKWRSCHPKGLVQVHVVPVTKKIVVEKLFNASSKLNGATSMYVTI